MMISNPGPTISAVDVSAFEAELGAQLPVAYREFLLRYNGGCPTPDIVDVPDASGSPTDLQVFFGLGRTEKTSDLSWNLSLIRKRCPTLLVLPVACDSGGNLFCLTLKQRVASDVVYCDLEDPNYLLYPVASSFTGLLDKLRSFGH